MKSLERVSRFLKQQQMDDDLGPRDPFAEDDEFDLEGPDHLVDSFINGNISYVREALYSMPQDKALAFAIHIIDNLPPDYAESFKRMLSRAL